MDQAPVVGMSVKLKHGMLRISARTAQRVTDTLKLSVEMEEFQGHSQRDVDLEGGYWIKTDYTKGEWWAWSHFRVA